MLWWRRRAKGQRFAVLVVLFVLISTSVIAVGPSWTMSVAGEPVAVAAATAEVGSRGVDLEFGDVHVSGPPGVAPVGTILTARLSHERPSGKAAELTLAGNGITLDLGGRQPAKPLTVTMPAPRPPDSAEAAVMVTRRSGSANAELLPASYSPEDGRITAEVSHLSPFWPAFIRFDALADFVRDFLGQTTGLTGKRPQCAGKSASIQDGGTITLGGDFSPKANPVVWPCLRIEGDKTVVTLTANGPLPWRVRAAPNAVLAPPGTVDAHNAVILSAYQTLVTHRPYAEGLLIPGVPMTYRLPTAELPGVVQGVADSGTYLGMALLFAFDLAMSVFGVDTKSIGQSVEALTCLGNAVEAADLSTSSAGSELADFARAVLNCAGIVAKAANGTLPGPAKVVLTILGSGIALVAAGIQGAVATVTNTDKFRIPLEVKYPGGDRAPATKVITVVPVNRSGNPAPGYSVVDEDTPVDCSYGDVSDPSPASVGRNIVMCSPSAAAADICWTQADRVTVLCGWDPRDKTLHRFRATAPINDVGQAPSPAPWQLELENGADCRLRDGGSWSGRSDNLVGAYYCRDRQEVVLASADELINKQSPKWTVMYGVLDDRATGSPPPQTIGVKTAYYAGSP